MAAEVQHLNHKRKRNFSYDDSISPPKHVPFQRSELHAVNAHDKEALRSEVKLLYTAYNQLIEGGEDDDEISYFHHLIDAATRGSAAAKRLSARLIPRFIKKFPKCVEMATNGLINLVEQPVAVHGHVNLTDATKMDALEGLGTVCQAATKMGEPAVPVALQIVNCLFRQLHYVFTPNRGLPSNPVAGKKRTIEVKLRKLLEDVFRAFPRVVLSVCLQALRGADSALYRAAATFMETQLLVKRSVMSEDGPVASFKHTSLASEVLSSLPDTQLWLHARIPVLLRDSQASGAKESAMLIDWLRQQVPFPEGHTPHTLQPTSALELLPQPTQRPHSPVHVANHPSSSMTPEPSTMDPMTHPHHIVRPTAVAPVGAHAMPARPQPLQHDGGLIHHAMPRSHGPDGTPAGSTNPAAMQNGTDPRDAHYPPAQVVAVPIPSVSQATADWRTPFPPPGGDVCQADACLWFGGLKHPGVNETVLIQAVRRFGVPEEVYLSPPSIGEAYIVFASVRDAAVCYEAMADSTLLGPVPVKVQFCSTLPDHSPLKLRQLHRPSPCVWVAGGSPTWAEEVLRMVQEANLPPPRQVIKVAGRAPGLILELLSPAGVPALLDALRLRLLHPSSAIAVPTVRLHTVHNLPPGMAAAVPGMPHAAGQQPYHTTVLAQQLPVIEANRALWVGQIHPSVREEEFIPLFANFGALASVRVVRSTVPGGCSWATVEYAAHASAAKAKEFMHNYMLRGCPIKVEWKGPDDRPMPAPITTHNGPGPRRPTTLKPPHRPVSNGSSWPGMNPLSDMTSPPGFQPALVLHQEPSAPIATAVVITEPVMQTGATDHPPQGIHPSRHIHRPGEIILVEQRHETWPLHQNHSDTPPQSSSQAPLTQQRSAPLYMPHTHPQSSVPSHIQQASHPAQLSPLHTQHTSDPLQPQPSDPSMHPHNSSHHIHNTQMRDPHSHHQQTHQAGQSHPLVQPVQSDWQPRPQLESPPPLPPEAPPPPLPSEPNNGNSYYHNTALPAQHQQHVTDSPPPPPPLSHHSHSHSHLSSLQSPYGPGPQLHPPRPGMPAQTQSPAPTADMHPHHNHHVHANHQASLPPAADPSADPQSAPAWSGSLAKSGAVICKLISKDGREPASAGPAGQEPLGWPSCLNVQMRVDLNLVVTQMYHNVASSHRAVRRLVPAERGDAPKQALLKFLQYLGEKSRAGVIRIAPVGALGPRTMYLIPPSSSVCEALGVEWEPKACLIALVLPQAEKGKTQ